MTLRAVGKAVGRDHHYVKRRLLAAGVSVGARPVRPLPKCNECGKSFRRSNRKQKYCSYACRGAAQRGGRLPRAHTQERACANCAIVMRVAPRSRRVFCSRECFLVAHSARMRGDNNPAWVNGSSYNKRCYRGQDWESVRMEVYKRDMFTCQACGAKCISRRDLHHDNGKLLIQCHHIRHYSGPADNDPANLLTLCVSCHAAVHAATRTEVEDA